MAGLLNTKNRSLAPQVRRQQRYWPGKAPAEEVVSSSDESEEGSRQGDDQPGPCKDSDESEEYSGDGLGEIKEFPPAEGQSDGGDGVGISSDGSDLDDEELESRRAKLRSRLLSREQVEERNYFNQDEEVEQRPGISDEDDASSSTGGADTGNEEDAYKPPVLAKPVFVERVDRTKEYNPELIRAQEDARRQLEELELNERMKETRRLISEELAKDKVKDETERDNKLWDVDDVDYPNDEVEYSKWKLRELSRLKREEEAALSREEEKRAAEVRSKLSNEEVAAEKAKEGLLLSQKSKSKLKFLQKYYHKGAFYVNEGRTGELLSTRDFTAPTLEDKFDKTSMPLAMQVKNFGRSGRVKYTHLTDQDTSKFGPNWYGSKEKQDKLLKKLGGYSSDFSRPSKKRRDAG